MILVLIVLSLILNLILIIFFDNIVKNKIWFYISGSEIFLLLLSIIVWISSFKKINEISHTSKVGASYQLSSSVSPFSKTDNTQNIYQEQYLEISEAINSSIASYELNDDRIFIKVNDEFTHILKKSPKNILGKKQQKFISNDSSSSDEYRMMWKNFRGGLPYNIEIKYSLDGNDIFLNESYSPVIKNDKLIKIIVLAIDITNSKKMQLEIKQANEEMLATEEELRQNMEELASIRDNLKDREVRLVSTLDAINNTMGSYEMSLNRVISKANEEYARTLSLDINQIENKKHNILISEKNIDKDIYEMMWENFEGGLPFTMEIAYPKAEGEIWLHESYTPIENNGVFDKILVLTIDITESKTFQSKIEVTNEELLASEEELRQNLEELQTIQENLSEREFELSNTFSAIDNSLGMFEISITGEIIKVNDEFINFLKQKEEDILFKNHIDVINLKEEDTDEYEMMWENFQGGLPYVMEINYKAGNNNIWLHESYTPISKKGKIIKILVFVIDITDSKHQTLKLQSLNKEMSAAEEELRQNMEELEAIQENLSERESQLRSTLDAINNTMGSYEVDFDGKIKKANDTFLDLLGIQNDEIINMKHILMISLDQIDKEEYIMMWENFEGGLSYEMDVLYKTEKGDVWLHESYTPILNRENQYDKILALVMNITVAKKQAIELTENSHKITESFLEIKDIQDTLETKEAELTSTIDAIGFSTYIAEYSLDGKILEMNDAYLKLFKRQKKIMIGKNIREFSNLNNEKFEKFWDRVTSGIMEKNVFDIEHDEKKFWLSEIYAPILDKDNKPNKILAIAFDITESEKHQMLLEKQSKKLEQNNKELEKLSIIARKTNNAIYILDTFGNVEWINQGFTKLYGYTIDDLKQIGANIIRLSEDKEIETNFYSCVNNGQSTNFEACSKNKKGVKIWKQTNLTPIFDNYGKTVKIVGIDTDITKNKEAEKEILKQRDLLHKTNVNISDSINYAKRIQNAILPPIELFEDYFSEHFILFKPRDVVSGDFYWAKEVNECFIFAAADCTGHGVPGAFVSMLGISILNELVRRKEITTGSQILQELRSQIKTMLNQTGKKDESKDGMDIAVCVLRNNKIEYSGANNPLYLIREKKNKLPDITDERKIKIHPTDNPNYTLIEYKPDRQPIGIHITEKPFTNNTIELCNNDSIYIFSDGYVDQFNEEYNKKFLSKNFKNLLISIADNSMSEQKQILDKTLKDWHGNANQLDDILVMGVKI